MNDTKHNPFDDFELISSYSRQQAIEDGFLIDVSSLAREAGFLYPVALTCGLWEDINAIPESKSWQDVSGRLWDVLTMGQDAVRRSSDGGSVLVYALTMHVGKKRSYTVKLVCAPGDDAEAVITLMRPDED